MSMRRELVAMLTGYYTTEADPETRPPAGRDESALETRRKTRRAPSVRKPRKPRATMSGSKQLLPETKESSPEQ